MKYGIGITTHNRNELFYESYDRIMQLLPPDTKVVVVDDASYIPVEEVTYRFSMNVGIAKAKNKCLELLQDCEHTFLFDSDCYPIADEWWRPYIESEEPHLMYQFKLPGKPKSDMKELYRDDKVVAYTHTRGAMIYIKKIVLEVVGGFDEAYGKAMFEHPDWTNRIYNAGLTSYRAMDVPNSAELIYCLDQDSEIESSIPKDVRNIGLITNIDLYRKSKTSREYKEYK